MPNLEKIYKLNTVSHHAGDLFMNKLKRLTLQVIGQNAAMKAAILSRRYSQTKAMRKEVIQAVIGLERCHVLEMLTATLSKSTTPISTRCAS